MPRVPVTGGMLCSYRGFEVFTPREFGLWESSCRFRIGFLSGIIVSPRLLMGRAESVLCRR